MHPNACFGRARDFLNVFAFITALGAVAPRIDAMNGDFAVCGKQLFQVICDICQSISRGALCSCSTMRINAGVPFRWNHEEGRGKVPFQLQISIELVPEVFGKSGKHQRQGKRGLPIGSYLSQRPSSSTKIDYRANQRPIEKAEHCVIAHVMADTRMINVMSKGNNKAIACRNRRYLDESHAMADDEFTEKRNVKFQCGYAGKLCWLPLVLRDGGLLQTDQSRGELPLERQTPSRLQRPSLFPGE